MTGRVVNIEFPADDVATSRAFYSELFGWGFEETPAPFTYLFTQTSDGTGVAITDMEPGKHGPRVYLDVDDIEAGRARVEELGGKATEARPVPGMGWAAVCSDPHGNDFGLWQDDPEAPARG
jgi:uncharacterized protein